MAKHCGVAESALLVSAAATSEELAPHLVQICDGVIRCWTERRVDVQELYMRRSATAPAAKPNPGLTDKRVLWFPSQLLPEELNDCLKPVGCCDFVKVLLHDRRVAGRLEPHHNCNLASSISNVSCSINSVRHTFAWILLFVVLDCLGWIERDC